MRMFDFKIERGAIEKAFSDPNNTILSESFADRIFGPELPIGQTIHLAHEDKSFTVTAIVSDLPKNSSLQFEVLMPLINAP